MNFKFTAFQGFVTIILLVGLFGVAAYLINNERQRKECVGDEVTPICEKYNSR